MRPSSGRLYHIQLLLELQVKGVPKRSVFPFPGLSPFFVCIYSHYVKPTDRQYHSAVNAIKL